VKIIDCKQGTSEWLAARCGLVTASEVDALLTAKWKVKDGAGPETYLYKKLAEKILGYSQDMVNPQGSWAMDQGQIVEKIALPWYEFQYNCTVRRVGFVTTDDGRCGCSPDGILGDDEGLEIKSPQPENALRYLLAGRVPEDYLPQIHFSLYVTGFSAWTFVSYSRHFPALVLRVERDEAIQSKIREALDGHFARFDAALERIAQLKSP
jgi:hypothetical protein